MLRIVAVFLAISLCQALECVKNEEGAMEFQDKGVVVVPEPFDCMRLTKPAETTLAIKYIDDDDEDRKVCKILDDGIMKEKKVYLKSDVPTDMKCRFICKDSTGLFKCKSQTKKSENACICDHAPHRLIIEPIANGLIGGQNEGEEEMSCAEKPMGFQVSPSCSVAYRLFSHTCNVSPTNPVFANLSSSPTACHAFRCKRTCTSVAWSLLADKMGSAR